MSSIRLRLFVTLALVTALVWGGGVVWVEIQTRAEVQRVLDRRLMESARMVSSLMQAGSVRPAVQAPDIGAADVYDRQLSCQIWSLEGDLIGRSQSAPAERLSEGGDGFSERTIQGERWRVYTVHDRSAGFRVMVGDNLAVREHLVGNVVTALIGPAVLGLLALGVLIWWSVGRGLAPIRQMTRSLAVRDAEDLTALDVSPDARELRPFALALNDLMSRLGAARRREAEFTAAAAHELRTPLAGLRVQAQIAASSSDPAVRSRALEQIQTAVDRTARLVTGLLALAREDEKPVELTARRRVSIRELFSDAESDARVRFSVEQASVDVDPDRFSSVANNLLENAKTYARSLILIRFDESSRTLIIEDDGPGVAFPDLHRLGQRFYRASNAPPGGSGLGLSIAAAVVRAHGGAMAFDRSPLGGLQVRIDFPELLS